MGCKIECQEWFSGNSARLSPALSGCGSSAKATRVVRRCQFLRATLQSVTKGRGKLINVY